MHLDHRMVAPATFEAHHRGQDHTWANTSGARSRIDYVCVHHAWAESIRMSKVLRDVDLLATSDDHFVVLLNVQPIRA